MFNRFMTIQKYLEVQRSLATQLLILSSHYGISNLRITESFML